MFLFQNVSGAAVINYYSPTLFQSIGLSDAALWTGVYGLVKGKSSLSSDPLTLELLCQSRLSTSLIPPCS